MVKITDRNPKTDRIRMALMMVDLPIDYMSTDLLSRVLEALDKMGDKAGEFSLKDAVVIRTEWEKDWEDYYAKQQEENK